MTNIQDFTRYISTYAPELRDLYLTLMPFNDVIHTVHAGPQYSDDSDEPAYFCLDFSIWEKGECIILRQWQVEKDRVFLKTCDGDRPSSMRQLHDFLRQLPRNPYAFTS